MWESRPKTPPRRRLRLLSALGAAGAILGLALAAANVGELGCGTIDTVVGAVGAGEAGASGDATGPIVEPAEGGCPPSSFYLAIASAELAGGFTIQSDPTAPNGAYLSPPPVSSESTPGDASAAYAFHVGCSSTYLLWGRIHGPGAGENSFWFQIDDGTFYQWRLSTGVIWYWKAATDRTDYGTPLTFVLDAGAHRLVFRNSSPDVGLAGLYVAVPGDEPPGNDTACDPPHSIQLADGGCQPSCGSLGGNTCSLPGCVGQTLLDAYDCTGCCYIAPGDAGAGPEPRDAGRD